MAGGDDRKITLRAKERYLHNVFKSYENMYLPDELFRILVEGRASPSFIERKGIVPLVTGLNVILQVDESNSFHSRKTLCCGMLGRVDCSVDDCQVLIFADTPESTKEFKQFLHYFGKHLGVRVGDFMDVINKKEGHDFHVVVDTPSNVSRMVHLRKTSHYFDGIISFVLYATEKMMSDSNEICSIFQMLRAEPKPQVGMFFAGNMSVELLRFARKLIPGDTIYFISREDGFTFEGAQIGDGQFSNPSINHQYMDVEEDYMKEVYINALLLNCGNRKKCTRGLWYFVHVTPDSFNILKDRFGNCPISFINREDAHEECNKFENSSNKILITTCYLRDIFETEEFENHSWIVINYDLPSPSRYTQQFGYGAKFTCSLLVISFITRGNDKEFYHLQDYCNHVFRCLSLSYKSLLFGP